MNDQIRQIAERLKGLRESLDLSTAEMAVRCEKKALEVERYESGEVDIPMSYLFDIAQHLGVDTSTLISGEEPHMKSYFLTRKGKGVSIERTKVYKYQALASGFKNSVSQPFEVTVEPNENPIYQNSHTGQEFNYVLEGRLHLRINDRDLILGEGDCIYFDSSKPHGMKALDGKQVKFLAIIM